MKTGFFITRNEQHELAAIGREGVTVAPDLGILRADALDWDAGELKFIPRTFSWAGGGESIAEATVYWQGGDDELFGMAGMWRVGERSFGEVGDGVHVVGLLVADREVHGRRGARGIRMPGNPGGCRRQGAAEQADCCCWW